jgi:hypothetical protein
MIKLIVDVYNSRIDRNGNTYWAFGLRDTQTGKSLAFKEGGSGSNATYWLSHELDYEWEDLHTTEHELPVRQFERMVKTWPYAHNASMILDAMNDAGFRGEPSGRRRHD